MRSSDRGEVTETLELHNDPVACRQGGLDLQSTSSSREFGLRSSIGSPVASPGTSAVKSRSYSATAALTA